MHEFASAKTFKVFVSSPGGMESDRCIIADEIASLSAHASLNNTPTLSLVAWPTSIAAGTADYTQAVINRQTRDLDVLICLVGSRMGTPTPRASSGTEEEFDLAFAAALGGQRIHIILFFSDVLVRPHSIDPHQFFMVRTFREKAHRLGVLYHDYSDHEELRSKFRLSLNETYRSLRLADPGANHAIQEDDSPALAQVVRLSDMTMKSNEDSPQRAPQGAYDYLIPLAPYRRKRLELAWTLETSSQYFRFGIKYFNSQERLFSTGSIQTPGQNIVMHVGKNRDSACWFKTLYRAGYRLGSDRFIDDIANRTLANFKLEISVSDILRFSMDGKQLYEMFFPIDEYPILALLGWGDEHEFCCEVRGLTLQVWHERNANS